MEQADVLELHYQRFFARYGKLVPKLLSPDKIKKNLKLASDLCARMEKRKDNPLNFNRNVLIVTPIDIHKELFLCGFSKLKEFKSYRYLNVYNIVEIQLSVDDKAFGITSLSSIHEDILCVEINFKEMQNKLLEDAVISLILNRNNLGKPTWLVAVGVEDDFRTNTSYGEKYGKILKMFKDDTKGCFNYFDFNSIIKK